MGISSRTAQGWARSPTGTSVSWRAGRTDLAHRSLFDSSPIFLLRRGDMLFVGVSLGLGNGIGNLMRGIPLEAKNAANHISSAVKHSGGGTRNREAFAGKKLRCSKSGRFKVK